MKDSSCLGISYLAEDEKTYTEAKYFPANFKEARKQLLAECKGKTDTSQLVGLHFKLVCFSDEDRRKFHMLATSLCNNTLKKYNGLQPPWYKRIFK